MSGSQAQWIPSHRECLEPLRIQWATLIHARGNEWHARLGRQIQKLIVATAFAGTNASGEVMRATGFSRRDLVASDPMASARRLHYLNGLKGSCSCGCIRQLHQTGMGWCWRRFSARCRMPSIMPDLAVRGFRRMPLLRCWGRRQRG